MKHKAVAFTAVIAFLMMLAGFIGCEKQESPVGNEVNLEKMENGELVYVPITKEQAYNIVIESGINPAEIQFFDIAPYDESDNGDFSVTWVAVVLENGDMLGTFVDAISGELLATLVPLPDGLEARMADLGINEGGFQVMYINQYNSFPWNWNLPFQGSAYVTQGYGGAGSSVKTHYGSIYYAVDWSGGGAANGHPVKASCAGWVMFATWANGANWQYGKQVILEAGDTGQGNGNRYMVRFSHMSSISVVAGWWVEKGTVLGYVGSTGYSTGPHLHWNINRGGYAGYGGVWGDSFPPSWPPGIDGYNGSYNCWWASEF